MVSKKPDDIPSREITDEQVYLNRRNFMRVGIVAATTVATGYVYRQLNTPAGRRGASPEKQLAGFLETVLQGRGQTANEIAAAALFLCSDQASAITGQSLNVDGGTAFY